MGERLEDTTAFRIARDVGFNARVEPIWHTFGKLSPKMGFLERWREKRKVQRLVDEVEARLKAGGIAEGGWGKAEGDCVCNLRVAKLGLVGEFKRWLKNAVEGDAAKKWPHVMVLRDQASILVPSRFSPPFEVAGGGENTRVIASAEKAEEELADIDAQLRIGETFAIKKMVDYLDATERDISIYESRFGSQEGFWARFAFVLLRKLAQVCTERRLPAILA